MPSTNESTMLICLFHHQDQARAALNDLSAAGIPKGSISTIGGEGARGSTSSTLDALDIPSRDMEHLREGLQGGGTVIAVFADPRHIDVVEDIFGKHQATQIDDTDSTDAADRNTPGIAGNAPPAAAAVAAATPAPTRQSSTSGEAARPAALRENAPQSAGSPETRVLPVVEEELAIGKRTVDQGGVRVFRRIVEMPADQSVNLREEHVVVERNAVDRAATPAELESQGERTIELTETAEEAVIAKNARIVEEVIVGKQVTEHTEHIHETVRRTEVEVEELPAASLRTPARRGF